jgi:hypothetical protein
VIEFRTGEERAEKAQISRIFTDKKSLSLFTGLYLGISLSQFHAFILPRNKILGDAILPAYRLRNADRLEIRNIV